jgi:hypothetical protein
MVYHVRMEVQMFPNSTRPGVGQKPRKEPQRPNLPQHARNCPVLEAGSALGFLVYPPLEPQESYHIEYQGDGVYSFTYFISSPSGERQAGERQAGERQAIFSIRLALPVGSHGKMKGDVEFLVENPPMPPEAAPEIARAFFSREDLGTPSGAITLLGATNFRTPPAWDSVYVPVLNMIERPIAPMLVVRVETDWYVHDSEFRYVLEPGEGISGTHSMPIGQVFFVPREEVTLRDSNEEELSAIWKSRDEFSREKPTMKRSTPYGLEYSPLYSRRSGPEKK